MIEDAPLSEKQSTLLIVEDDPGLQSQLRWSFEGFDVEVAGDRASALAQLKRHQPPVVTLDLGLPPVAFGVLVGLVFFVFFLVLVPDTKVIVVSGFVVRV